MIQRIDSGDLYLLTNIVKLLNFNGLCCFPSLDRPMTMMFEAVVLVSCCLVSVMAAHARDAQSTGGYDGLVAKLALLASCCFTGAAFYINIAEQPARLRLKMEGALSQWKLAYIRGFAMQASLAVLSGSAGLYTYYVRGDWQWLLGGLCMLLNWPYTLLLMMPTNKRLMATQASQVGMATKELMVKWGSLHAFRTLLGAIASVLFLITL
ncbi:hypothetical protein DUNSADRAFT_2552 [Dunaliella salina]|uniref:Uncharacterized protein n=1 Tax=Dunaliella salina TaxID=3046 RepID=A0ABQ7FW62_DUNSA|nr:hypothetical protein DUNSADRAFT_2552 [Dunaliella salina]|eukprot:KAF5826604.1 hypothetical protein DUNSADRAFT_2552 [Dunaliella salina]